MKKILILVFLLAIGYYTLQQNLSSQMFFQTSENTNQTTFNQVPITCLDCRISDDVLKLYQTESYAIPKYVLPFLDQFTIVPQATLDELFSPLTSGYTKTYFENEQYVRNEIYISDTLFRKTTLLHEALHVVDAALQVSTTPSFIEIMNQEMNQLYNERIYEYYDHDAYASEYFVESFINYLYE